MSAPPTPQPRGDTPEPRRTRVIASTRRRVHVDEELLTRALVLIAEDLARSTDHHDD
jgi:hypothetical protein